MGIEIGAAYLEAVIEPEKDCAQKGNQPAQYFYEGRHEYPAVQPQRADLFEARLGFAAWPGFHFRG